MQLRFHFVFCFSAEAARLLKCLGLEGRPASTSDLSFPPKYWQPLLKPETVWSLQTNGRFDAQMESKPFRVAEARLLSPYDRFSALELVSDEKQVAPADLAAWLAASKAWAREIQRRLLEIDGILYDKDEWAFREEGLLKPDSLLLTSFSETGFLRCDIDPAISKCLAEYCDSEGSGSPESMSGFLSGLSSNAAVNFAERAEREARWLIVAATLNYALADFIRIWARYAAGLLAWTDQRVTIGRDQAVDTFLQRARLVLQDAAAENFLSSGIHEQVYQAIWNAWQGEGVLAQAEQRCERVSRILSERSAWTRTRLYEKLTIGAYLIALFSLGSLFVDLWHFFEHGDLMLRGSAFLGFLMVLVLLAAGVLWRRR